VIFGNFNIFLCAFDDSLTEQIVEEGQEMMHDKEPSSRFIGFPQIFGDVLNDGLFDFVKFISKIWIDHSVDIFAKESRRQGNYLTGKVYELLNFFVDYFFVPVFAFEDKFVNVPKMFEFVENDAEIGGQGVFERSENFDLRLFDRLFVDGDGLALLFSLDDFQDEVNFEFSEDVIEHADAQRLKFLFHFLFQLCVHFGVFFCGGGLDEIEGFDDFVGDDVGNVNISLQGSAVHGCSIDVIVEPPQENVLHVVVDVQLNFFR
jgi:hypothetical protein